MAWATLVLLRRVTHFTTSNIIDTDVTNLIAEADRAVMRLTTSEVWLEKLDGTIDGTNTDFRTKYSPIADFNVDGSIDGSDVTVYYATFDDTTGWTELGTAKTVTSIQAETGIITMETAPTTETAEGGVYVIYRYDTQGKTDYDVLALAATYYLAYLVTRKLAGETMTYREIAGARFYPIGIGADWLKLCYETLALQDKIFLVRAEGVGLPTIPQPKGIKEL